MMMDAARWGSVERLDRPISDAHRNEPIIPGPEATVGGIGLETDGNSVFKINPPATLNGPGALPAPHAHMTCHIGSTILIG